MAWRIDEHVVRGEIDNRIRGRVTGSIWFAGRDQPVTLHLAGNAWRDLAGRRLEFINPTPQTGLHERFSAHQAGATGDITASRKVRVPDIPLDQIGEYYAARKPFPWHWGNSLYLEWFSTTNGRVVIESASYQLTISPDSTWDMTAAEEETQRAENGVAIETFMDRIAQAADAEKEAERPQTEAEAEKLQADSDRLIDRVMARMEREAPNADYEKIVAEEIERARKERGEPDLTPEQEAERDRWIEEMNAAATEAASDKAEAWKRGAEDESGDSDDAFEAKHPLSARAYALSLRVMREIEERDWIPNNAGGEHPVIMLEAGITSAGAKLAGALDAEDWPPPLEFAAGVIVRLKRAANYLEDAKLAAESCREESLVDPAWLIEIVREIAAISTETDTLILELRTRLNDQT